MSHLPEYLVVLRRAGGDLAKNLSVLGAYAINEVAGRALVLPDEARWPVQGVFLDPGLSVGVLPIDITMTMRPVYAGFDFSDQLPQLHAALRRYIWDRLQIVRAEELHIDLLDPAQLPYTFSLRIEFMQAGGSEVAVGGDVMGEYGGDTGVRRM